MTVLFVLGGPGAGKSTQCPRIAEKYGMTHLSAGELLRQAREGEHKDVIEERMKAVSLLVKAMEESGAKKFLIEGFPRNEENLSCWLAEQKEEGMCLILHCPENVLSERLTLRAESSGRIDDTGPTIVRRLRSYEDSTIPIASHFGRHNKLIQVSAAGNIDEVWVEIQRVLDPALTS